MINNRFLFYKTINGFERDKSEIPQDSIVFIKEPAIIWTHGTYYTGQSSEDYKHVVMTESQYDALDTYERDTIYLLVDKIDQDDTEWHFDGQFPIILDGDEWRFDGQFPIVLDGDWQFDEVFPIKLI